MITGGGDTKAFDCLYSYLCNQKLCKPKSFAAMCVGGIQIKFFLGSYKGLGWPWLSFERETSDLTEQNQNLSCPSVKII